MGGLQLAALPNPTATAWKCRQRPAPWQETAEAPAGQEPEPSFSTAAHSSWCWCSHRFVLVPGAGHESGPTLKGLAGPHSPRAVGQCCRGCCSCCSPEGCRSFPSPCSRLLLELQQLKAKLWPTTFAKENPGLAGGWELGPPLPVPGRTRPQHTHAWGGHRPGALCGQGSAASSQLRTTEFLLFISPTWLAEADLMAGVLTPTLVADFQQAPASLLKTSTSGASASSWPWCHGARSRSGSVPPSPSG